MVQTLLLIHQKVNGLYLWAPFLEVPSVYRLPRTQTGFSRAQLVKILEASTRPESLSSQSSCGAHRCHSWGQLIVYEQQLVEKRNGVISALERIGHFTDDVSELVRYLFPRRRAWGYRNKVNLHLKRNGNKTLVGMYAP